MLQRSQHTFLNVHVNFVGFTRRTRVKYKDIDAALSILEANLGRCKALSLYNVRSAGFGEFFPPLITTPPNYIPSEFSSRYEFNCSLRKHSERQCSETPDAHRKRARLDVEFPTWADAPQNWRLHF